MVVAVGETEAEPETALPVEKPVPMQEVALVLDQVRVEDEPAAMEVGFAVSVAVVPLSPVKWTPFVRQPEPRLKV